MDKIDLRNYIQAYLDVEKRYRRIDYTTSTNKVDILSVESSDIDMRKVDVYIEWRDEMVWWCYNAADSCDISREIVFVALSFLDRLFYKLRCSEVQFKLAAMTCFFLAVKLAFRPLDNTACSSDVSVKDSINL